MESQTSNEQQTICMSKWSNNWTDNVFSSKCGLPGPGNRPGILCAYSTAEICWTMFYSSCKAWIFFVRFSGCLILKEICQPSLPQRCSIKLKWGEYETPSSSSSDYLDNVSIDGWVQGDTLHDLNPLILQEACYNPGCMGSCIVLLEQWNEGMLR